MTNLFSKIATTGAVLLGTSGVLGCGDTGQEKYEFEGLIDGEWVEFYTTNLAGDIINNLIVEGAGGIRKGYWDDDYNDLKIESFSAENHCAYTKKSVYRKCNPEPLAEEQADFERYLEKILNEKERREAQEIRGN